MTCQFLPEAQRERDVHMAEYETKKPGLGIVFLDEIVFAIGQIIDQPHAWPTIEPNIRRRLTDRFPFGVNYHYNEKEQEILIIAIMHHRQKPGYWKKRI